MNLPKQRRQSNAQLIQLFVGKNISREDVRPSMVRKMFPVERSFARVRKLAEASERETIDLFDRDGIEFWLELDKKEKGRTGLKNYLEPLAESEMREIKGSTEVLRVGEAGWRAIERRNKPVERRAIVVSPFPFSLFHSLASPLIPRYCFSYFISSFIRPVFSVSPNQFHRFGQIYLESDFKRTPWPLFSEETLFNREIASIVRKDTLQNSSRYFKVFFQLFQRKSRPSSFYLSPAKFSCFLNYPSASFRREWKIATMDSPIRSFVRDDQSVQFAAIF